MWGASQPPRAESGGAAWLLAIHSLPCARATARTLQSRPASEIGVPEQLWPAKEGRWRIRPAVPGAFGSSPVCGSIVKMALSAKTFLGAAVAAKANGPVAQRQAVVVRAGKYDEELMQTTVSGAPARAPARVAQIAPGSTGGPRAPSCPRAPPARRPGTRISVGVLLEPPVPRHTRPRAWRGWMKHCPGPTPADPPGGLPPQQTAFSSFRRIACRLAPARPWPRATTMAAARGRPRARHPGRRPPRPRGRHRPLPLFPAPLSSGHCDLPGSPRDSPTLVAVLVAALRHARPAPAAPGGAVRQLHFVCWP